MLKSGFALSIGVLITQSGAAPVIANNDLAGHPSPYLNMHAQDPVHWRTWNRSAVSEAQGQDKPLFVSVGYFACHWCHVMQRESYQNTNIAEILNESFIPVKVDRELDPALDSYLIKFVQRTRGYAGWPLNVVLTPSGHPLIGMTSSPPEDLQNMLKDIRQRWHADKEALKSTAAKAAQLLAKGQPKALTFNLTPDTVATYKARFVRQAFRLADELVGGFGTAVKFPSVPQLRTLLFIHQREPSSRIAEFLRLTLRKMSSLGLRDQLGGGFFRYVTDPGWQVPHFEKMLYDNALLAALYLDTATVLDEPRFEAVARNTLDFMLEEMRNDAGAFIASLSAVDSHGVDGGYYLWDEQTLKRVLSPPEVAVATRAWRLDGVPILDAGHLPMQGQALKDIAIDLDLAEDQVHTLIPQPTREPILADGPMPSPSAVLLRATFTVGNYFNAPVDVPRGARETLRMRHAGPAENPYRYATHLAVLIEKLL